MAIVMNMSDYEIEREPLEVEYSEEIMYSGWNPEVETVHEQLQIAPTTEQASIPEDLATVAAGLFLREMYSYSR